MSRSNEILVGIGLSLDNINKAFDTIEKYQKKAEENRRMADLIDSRLQSLMLSPSFQSRIKKIMENVLRNGLSVEVSGTEGFSGEITGNVRVLLDDHPVSCNRFDIKGSAARTFIR